MSYSRWGAPGAYQVDGEWFNGTGDWYVYPSAGGFLAVYGPSEHVFTLDEVRNMHARRDVSAVTGATNRHTLELLWYFGEYIEDCERWSKEDAEREATR